MVEVVVTVAVGEIIRAKKRVLVHTDRRRNRGAGAGGRGAIHASQWSLAADRGGGGVSEASTPQGPWLRPRRMTTRRCLRSGAPNESREDTETHTHTSDLPLASAPSDVIRKSWNTPRLLLKDPGAGGGGGCLGPWPAPAHPPPHPHQKSFPPTQNEILLPIGKAPRREREHSQSIGQLVMMSFRSPQLLSNHPNRVKNT